MTTSRATKGVPIEAIQRVPLFADLSGSSTTGKRLEPDKNAAQSAESSQLARATNLRDVLRRAKHGGPAPLGVA